MKTLLYVILLFYGFNGFAQQILSPNLVEENDTLKRIKLNGKVGLIHKNGKVILEPKYTNVLIDQLGILFFENGLQGYLPNGAEKAIPANYKKIVQVYSFFAGRTENETMDLYHGTELIASDLDPWLSETDILLETGLVIVRRDEKTGLMNEKGEIVVPIEYSSIGQIPSFKYNLSPDISVDYILNLDQTDYFYSPESNGFLTFEAKHLLAKADGSLITDSVFSLYWTVNPETNTISLNHGKKMATLYSDFRVEYSPYESEEDFQEWKLCATGKEVILFNRFREPIDSFAEVQIPHKMSWIANEEGEMTSYTETLFEEFVYVVKPIGEDNRTAIYDLKNEKLVSNWEKSITYQGKGINPSGTTVWIFKDETEKFAFSISTNGKSSPFEYQDIYHAGQQFYGFKKEGEAAYTLCELIGDTAFVERAQIEKSFGSYNYVGMNTPSVREIDPQLMNGFKDDFGNYYTYKLGDAREDPAFRAPLALFKNTKGKLGFISWNGKVVDLNADTLFQNKTVGTLIEYRYGDLWGAADMSWGSVFKADQNAPGFFYMLDGLALIYRLNENEKHYVDHKGRIFYSVNTERYISKKGKFKGSEIYSDFEDASNKKTEAIPYKYTEIAQTWNGIDFLAKGTNKKWGVISAYADTLFPFKYDELRFGISKENTLPVEFPYRDYDEQCFTRIGELHGVLSLNLRKEIPAVYNQVSYVPNAAFIVRKNHGSGVYDYNLNEKISPVFDEVFIASSQSEKYFLRAKKNNKWYNAEFFEGKVPDQVSFLQVPAFDLVINETGFIKTASGYEARDFNNVLIQKDAVMTDYLDENQFKLVDGKIFLLDLKGKSIYPEGLTNIVILEDGRVISAENGTTYSYAAWKKSKVIYPE